MLWFDLHNVSFPDFIFSLAGRSPSENSQTHRQPTIEGVPFYGSLGFKVAWISGRDFPGKYEGYFDRMIDVGIGFLEGLKKKERKGRSLTRSS